MGKGKRSAGIILYRHRSDGLQVLIAHMGGPHWADKVGRGRRGWSIPKGEYDESEDAWVAACREFREETGHDVPDGDPLSLGEVTQKSGKRVTAWAVEGDLDPAEAVSNSLTIEWPRKSGRTIEFPEVDRVEWVTPAVARKRVIEAQAELFDRMEAALAPPTG